MRRGSVPLVAAAVLAAACSPGATGPVAAPDVVSQSPPVPSTAAASGSPTASPPATPSPSLAPPLAGAPTEYYATVSGRVAAFDSATGERLRFLTTPPPGAVDGIAGVVVTPAGRSVYFVRGREAPGCGGEVHRVPAAGGETERVLRTSDILGAVGVDRDGTTLAYVYTPCDTTDGRQRVRVVSPRDGRTLAEAYSSFHGNGVITIGSAHPRGDQVVIGLGIHLQAWTVVLDVRPGARPVDLDTLPSLPGLESCPQSGAWWTPVGEGMGLASTVTCHGEPTTTKYLRWSGDGYETVREARLPVPPEGLDLTGSDQRGHLIGVRYSDEGRTTRVVQIGDAAARELPPCEETGSAANDCPVWPVW